MAWRQFRREMRSGELLLLAVALTVAVAAVTAVGFFADRVRQALTTEAQRMLGGDLVLVADQPVPAAWIDEARRRGLLVGETQTFPSMVRASGRLQLADLKAVSDTYPLRGELRQVDPASGQTRAASQGPLAGQAWPDERLAQALGLAPGDTIDVGRVRLTVTAILAREPDRGIGVFALAPRLLMSSADLAASELAQPGARLRHRLLVAGERPVVAGFRDWLAPRLARGQRLEDLENARPEIRSALDRAERFLGLATLLTVVLSAIAVALAARRYLQRHLDACAVLRCLGMTQGRLLRLHAALFGWLALLAVAAGSLLGLLAHEVLLGFLQSVLGADLPPPGLRPLLQGSAVALVLLAGFAWPPLVQLARVPTLRVLRRELEAGRSRLALASFAGAVLLAGLVVAAAGDLRLGGLAVAGFAGAALVFWGVAWGAVALAGRLRRGRGFGWRHGLAGLARRAGGSSLQVVALAVGGMALLLLTETQSALLRGWQQSLPPEAPNRFVINIQPDQRQAVLDQLAAAGVAAEAAPMVRARLLRVGGRSVGPADYAGDERAQRLVEREFNLSWRTDLPPGNQLAAGRWFGEGAAAAGAVGETSVEAGLARTLGIALGDELLFAVAGSERRVRVTSLRRLDWDSMQVNFFVLMPPGVIDDLPATYLTSIYVPAAAHGVTVALVERFPNLTVIDVEAALAEFRQVLGQVSGAVRFVALFALLAGAVVLFAALHAAVDERRQEFALLRALGASRRQLRAALLAELAAVGGLAGLIAAGGAAGVGWLIARRVFDFDLALSPTLFPLAMAGGALVAMAVGALAVGRLARTPPLLALRGGE